MRRVPLGQQRGGVAARRPLGDALLDHALQGARKANDSAAARGGSSPKQLGVAKMADGTRRPRQDQQRVAVAVGGDAAQLEKMARGLALRPQPLLAAAEEGHASALRGSPPAPRDSCSRASAPRRCRHAARSPAAARRPCPNRAALEIVASTFMAAPRCLSRAQLSLQIAESRSRRCETRWRRAPHRPRRARNTLREMLRASRRRPRRPAARGRCARTARELLDVVAVAHAVARHAVEHDLAGAALLHLAHPVRACCARLSRVRVRIAGVLLHAIAVGAWSGCRCRRPRTGRRSARSSSSISSGSASAGELTEIFSAPAPSTSSASATRADAAGDAERDVEHARHAAHPGAIDRAALGARGDVVEHQLVRALVAIARGELQDVADDAVVAEAHALDDLAVAHVEAGDYASGKNGRSSSSGMRSSSSALPLIAAAAPHVGQRAQIARVADAAGGLPLRSAESVARASAYSAEVRSGERAVAARCRCTARAAGRASAKLATASHSDSCGLLAPAVRAHARHARRVEPHVEGQADALGAEVVAASVRTCSGRSTAALPMTTRATPQVEQFARLRRGCARRRRPAACTRALRGQVGDRWRDCPALPSRAPSRSTTCSQSAPSRDSARAARAGRAS